MSDMSDRTQSEEGELHFSQFHFSSEDNGSLSLLQWVEREPRQIKVQHRCTQSIEENLCVVEFSMARSLIISVNHNAIGGGWRNAELLYHHAKGLRILARHLTHLFLKSGFAKVRLSGAL